MYTAEASIDAKVKGASGWRELLKLLGFRFQKASNGIPDSVFFPSANSADADKLATASNHLHALLGKRECWKRGWWGGGVRLEFEKFFTTLDTV